MRAHRRGGIAHGRSRGATGPEWRFATVALAATLGFVGALVERQGRLTDALATATLERDKSAEVSRFLSSLFDDADPRREGASEITARDLLTRGAGRIDTLLAGQPQVRAEMQSELGRMFVALGDYDAALGQHRRAVATLTEALGPDDLATARATRQMGAALLNAGRSRRRRIGAAQSARRPPRTTGRTSLRPGAELQ